jgi:hypothetical protein
MGKSALCHDFLLEIVQRLDHESYVVRESFYSFMFLLSIFISFFGVMFQRLSLTVALPFISLLFINWVGDVVQEEMPVTWRLFEQLALLHITYFFQHLLSSSLFVFAVSAIVSHILASLINVLSFALFMVTIVYFYQNRPLVNFFAEHSFSYFLLSLAAILVIFIAYIVMKKRCQKVLLAFFLSYCGSFFVLLSFEKLANVDLGMEKIIINRKTSAKHLFNCCHECWTFNLQLFISLLCQICCTLRKRQ